MNPSVLVALANLQRPRRGDTAPRTPLGDVRRARQRLAEDGIAVDPLTREGLSSLTQLVDAVSELADGLALRRPPAGGPVDVINEMASGCKGRMQLRVIGPTVTSSLDWDRAVPVAGLARRVIEELGTLDLSRLRHCQRLECDLLFLDPTRSRSQRWHAENPCGWLERQHRRRGT